MIKSKKGESVEAPTKEELLDLIAANQKLLARFAAVDLPASKQADDADDDEDEKPAKKKSKAVDPDEEEEAPKAETDDGEGFEMPDAKAISKMKAKALVNLAETINLPDAGDADEDDLRSLLTTVAGVVSGEHDDLETDDLKALCVALSIKPAKKDAAMIESITEYFQPDNASGEGEAAEAEAKDTEDTDDKKKSDDDSDGDGIDREAVAKAAELPDRDTMMEQLEAFNASVADDEEIEVEPGKVKVAYRKLLAKLVTSDGEIAEWEEPYIRDGEVCCCGVGLSDHAVKGEKGDFGKCAVSGKIFKVADDGEATEYKAKKK